MKSNEKSYLWEQERKRAQTEDEAELKKEQEAIIRMQKKKEVISAEESISDDLWKLRDLLEKHVIDDLLIKKVMQEAELNHKDIEEISVGIEEIDELYFDSEKDIENFIRKVNSRSIKKEKRDFITIKIQENNEYYIGQLILFFESLTALMGHYLEIDPFNQPGVELGKKYAFEYIKNSPQ